MRLALFVAMLALAAFAMPEMRKEPKLFFAFFMKGDGPRPEKQEELTAMQASHIENLKRQFAAGKLIAAGPVKDPTTERRGIMVLTVEDEKDIPSLFTLDPYVQGRIMTVDAKAWSADRKRINTELPDPNAIEENRIVVVTAVKPLSDADAKAHATHTAGEAAKGVGGWVGKRERAIYLFSGPEDETLKKAFESDPLIAKGLIKVEIFPLWMAKGALPARG